MPKKYDKKELAEFRQRNQHDTEEKLISASLSGEIPELVALAEVKEWAKLLPRDSLQKLKFRSGQEGEKMPLLLRILFHWIKEFKKLCFFFGF